MPRRGRGDYRVKPTEMKTPADMDNGTATSNNPNINIRLYLTIRMISLFLSISRPSQSFEVQRYNCCSPATISQFSPECINCACED